MNTTEIKRPNTKSTKKDLWSYIRNLDAVVEDMDRRVDNAVTDNIRMRRELEAEKLVNKVAETAVCSCESANNHLHERNEKLERQILYLVEKLSEEGK